MSDSDPWPRYQRDRTRTGYNPSASPPADTVTEQWQFEVGDWGPNSLQPVVSDSKVYVNDGSDSLYAIDRETGEKVWAFEGQNTLGSFPTVTDNRVYVGGTAELPDIGVVGRLYALDSETGEKQLHFDVNSACGTPIALDDTIYVGDGSGYIYAIEKETANKKWRFSTSPYDRSIVKTPALDGNTLYASTQEGQVYAINLETGREKWRFESEDGGFTSPVVSDGSIYVAASNWDDESDKLYALDKEGGEPRWVFTDGFEISYDQTTAPAIAYGTVYAGGTGGTLHAIDSESGTEKWQFDTGESINEPTVANRMVYFGDSDGNLYAVNTESGTKEWRINIDGWGGSGPAIAENNIYVSRAGEEGRIYAFK